MSNQEYTHLALDGIVREINDFEVHSVSLVPAEQALHPSWRVLEVEEEDRNEQ